MPGDVVSFMLANGAAAATIFLGAMYGGFVVSPVNLLIQDAHLDYMLAHAAPKRDLRRAGARGPARAALARTGGGARTIVVDVDAALADADAEADADADADRAAPAPLAGSAPAMLMYTSGTTGLPKGVLLTHANMLHAGRAVARALALIADDRVLSSLPLYHINGQCIATVSPLVCGGSIVMPHRFSASQWWPLVERYRPTWLNLVPTIIAYLLNGPRPHARASAACRGVRFARSASAPLPPEQHRAFEARFGIGGDRGDGPHRMRLGRVQPIRSIPRSASTGSAGSRSA